MAKHIMLLFLSDVKVDFKTGKVRETTYYNISARRMTGEITLTTNESAVRYVLHHECRAGEKISKIYIFASEKVRNETVIIDNTKITHLQHFKERMRQFIPNIDECINDDTISNYRENNSPNDNMLCVAEMAQRIQKFAAAAQDEIILHVDFTGGLRNVNMMMLDVIRLLEYSGVKIERLLYSNYQTGYVEETNNVYDLFQLISGVEEFIQFGSVKVLEKYYATSKNIISVRLQNLIAAMKNFSEEIKLCHYGQFINSVKNLHDAINDFEVEPNNLQDTLMARLIGRIRAEYGTLIDTRGEDDLKIIRWCVEKGYLQQALTLYTERIPEVLGEREIISMTPAETEKLQRAVKGDVRAAWFYLLNQYKSEDVEGKMLNEVMTKTRDKLRDEYIKLVTEALETIKKSAFDYDSWREKISAKFKDACANLRKIFNEPDYYNYAKHTALEMSKFNYANWMRGVNNYVSLIQLKRSEMADLPIGADEFIFENEPQVRAQFELLIKIKQNPAMLEDLSAPELEPLKNIFDCKISSGNTINAELEQIADINKRVKRLLVLIRENAKALFQNINFRRSMANLRVYDLYTSEIFSISIAAEKFFSIIEKYFVLKDERNHSNHARQDLGEFKTATELQEYILAALDEIESVMQGEAL